MKKPFIDHLFSKIVEGRYEKALSSAAVKAKLEQLENVSEKIGSMYGNDAIQNVLGYREVKRCLEQCLDFIQNSSSEIEDVDFTIYLDFARFRLEEGERIIDSELSDLGL
ncbi:hypothetical protein E2J97_14970 [Vibrio cholerae]|nr:hypothetical protein [Vibrio fluvialis]EGR0666562.1 hypothetical protein [Vibrio cholerae]EJB8442101.1 hypothetical protein [Vibrio parahaemolyticus]EJG1860617.1 hypothetical protein [Vibrio parahaemolyticus]MBY7864224.1 hypothetical protein [Vibrio fluvialis]MCG6359107.1 hypothetical protein [Vibrio fluvialis]